MVEGAPLLRAYMAKTVSRVRIPLSPPDKRQASSKVNGPQPGPFLFAPTSVSFGKRTGFQPRVMRVQLLPPMRLSLFTNSDSKN